MKPAGKAEEDEDEDALAKIELSTQHLFRSAKKTIPARRDSLGIVGDLVSVISFLIWLRWLFD